MSALKWIVTGKQLASKRIAQLLPKQKFIKNNIRRLETSTNGPVCLRSVVKLRVLINFLLIRSTLKLPL
jgi:hypothetical protein